MESDASRVVVPPRPPQLHELSMKSLGGIFLVPESYTDIFCKKGIRTSILSIGSSDTCLPELDLTEDLGCPIHIAPLSKRGQDEWLAAIEFVKTKVENSTHSHSEFLAGAKDKWILPTNLRLQDAISWWTEGTLLEGSVKGVPVHQYVESICTQSLRLPVDATRLDFLKIDTVRDAPGLERGLIAAILDAGFRPALICIHWSESPDEGLATAFAAGHLQNSGYRLISTAPDNAFTYYFTDSDLYQICSWINPKVANPMVAELADSMRRSFNTTPK